MGNRIIRKINIILCLCIAFVLIPLKGVAAPEDDTSLTIKHLAEGVNFTFYKVADFSEYGKFELTENFEKYVGKVKNLEMLEDNSQELTTEIWMNLAKTLEGFVIEEKVPHIFIERTGENATLTIDNIDKALYLVLGDSAEIDGKKYAVAPVLITVPNRDEDGAWNSEVVLDYSGKLSPEDAYDKYIVIKRWEDEGYEDKRTGEIHVKLYVDRKEYATVTLNEENNWRYEWTDLPKGTYYSAFEVDLPEEYEVDSYSDGGSIVIVNTYKPNVPGNPPGKPGGKLPQTGQLWWPVPFLAITGIALFSIGWTRKKSEDR